MQLVLSGILTMTSVLLGIKELGLVRWEKKNILLKIFATMVCGIGLALIFKDLSIIFLLGSVLLFLLLEKNEAFSSIVSVTITITIVFVLNLLLYSSYIGIINKKMVIEEHPLLVQAILDTFILILTFFICKLIRKVRARLERTNIYSMIFSVNSVLVVSGCLIFLLICIVNIFVMRKVERSEEFIILSVIISISYCIIIGAVGVIIYSNLKKDIETKAKEKELKDLREYSSNLEDLYNDMRKFRHDYVNILSSLAGYIEEDDMKGLRSHFNDNIAPLTSSLSNKNMRIGRINYIKVKEIKGILITKILKAQEAGIEVLIDVAEIISEARMDIIDLCRCLGILIDNAQEEAIKCEIPRIEIGFVKRKDTLLIIVINSVTEEVPPIYKIFERGFSTKGENRGIGLTNIREILSKYPNASLDTIVENNEFKQILELS